MLSRGDAQRNEGKDLKMKQRKHMVSQRDLASDGWDAHDYI